MCEDKIKQTALLPRFDVSVQSDDMAVREALEQVLASLDPLDMSVEEIGTVELVLAEVLNNIVEHAYPDPSSAGPITIACTHRPDGLHLHITDQGEAMPNGALPVGKRASLDVGLDDLPEGGFGWFLIRDLAKDVSYQRVGAENHLSMRLSVAVLSATDS